jgi:hypothetical protein
MQKPQASSALGAGAMSAVASATSPVDSKPAAAANPSSSAIESKLERILDAVEQDRRRRWVEVLRALVLGLATIGSTWCAYQSSRWGGVQAFELAAAGQSDRHAVREAMAAVQVRAFDATMLIHYVRALQEKHEPSAEFLYRRLRPQLKSAVDEWMATSPFTNADAPRTPFEMPAYVQPEAQEAVRQQQAASAAREAAQRANHNSDRYVMLTVAFASVLFFGGIGGTFQSYVIRLTMAAVAAIVLISISIALATMPVCP